MACIRLQPLAAFGNITEAPRRHAECTQEGCGKQRGGTQESLRSQGLPKGVDKEPGSARRAAKGKRTRAKERPKVARRKPQRAQVYPKGDTKGAKESLRDSQGRGRGAYHKQFNLMICPFASPHSFYNGFRRKTENHKVGYSQ